MYGQLSRRWLYALRVVRVPTGVFGEHVCAVRAPPPSGAPHVDVAGVGRFQQLLLRSSDSQVTTRVPPSHTPAASLPRTRWHWC
jgi:hypothetical protein